MRERLIKTRSVAAASIPIVSSGELLGWVVADVVDHPERLTLDTDLTERLRGLAGQAGNALGNARLLDLVSAQARHDGLTGRPNRVLLLEEAERILAGARTQPQPVAALFIDIDHFKHINDVHGHEAGDAILKAVAVRLAAGLRGGDVIGRLGGDEFVVFLAGGAQGLSPELVATRLLETLREPFALETNGTVITVGASIGIATGDRANASELIRDADLALYEAKSAGRGHYSIFEPTGFVL
jgi:diguanylate cyclase (GGDEF)-like protein